jgi:hypothetical protein
VSGGRTRKRCASACGGWIDCRDLPCVFDHEGPLPLVTHGAAGALAAKNATSRFGGEAFPARATGPFGTGAYFGRLSDAGRMAAEQGRRFVLFLDEAGPAGSYFVAFDARDARYCVLEQFEPALSLYA